MRVLSSVFVLCALALARPTAAGRRVEEKKRRKEREAAAAAATDERGLTKAQGPPAFFLQDPNDATCMSGKEFRRCAIDNLWQVVGKAGAYKITLRKSDEDQDEQCLDAVSCDGDEADVRLWSCKHCGAAEWNIHGDKESGYVLSRGGTSCLGREPGGKAAKMVPCAEADRVVYMALQFAGKSDLEAMESVGASAAAAAAAAATPQPTNSLASHRRAPHHCRLGRRQAFGQAVPQGRRGRQQPGLGQDLVHVGGRAGRAL